WRADIIAPAVGKFLGRIVEPPVLAAGHVVVRNRGFQVIAGHITFVLAAAARAPMLRDSASIARGSERKPRLQVTVGLLRGEDDWNPLVNLVAHFGLSIGNFLVPLRIDHLCQAHGLERVKDPSVGEWKNNMKFSWFAAKFLSSFDQV